MFASGEIQFKDWYRATLEEKFSQDYRVREPIWSEAIAVQCKLDQWPWYRFIGRTSNTLPFELK